MPTYTTRMNLEKFIGNENVSRTAINANSDIIDNATRYNIAENITMPWTFLTENLRIKDVDESNSLGLRLESNLTADRLLTINTGDDDRIITLNGNTILNDWFDQDVKMGSSPHFFGMTLDTPLQIEYGGTGSNNGSITGNGEIVIQAGGSDEDINILPSGIGVVHIDTIKGQTANPLRLFCNHETGITINPTGNITIEGADPGYETNAWIVMQPTFGNIGIGITDIEAWTTDWVAMQIGGVSAISAIRAVEDGSTMYISNNAYYDGSWKYTVTGKTSVYSQYSGHHLFRVAQSGTKDAAITWQRIVDMQYSQITIGTGDPDGFFILLNGSITSGGILPIADNYYYLGRNSITPFSQAWKGLILKDQGGTSKTYRLEVYNDALRIVEIT